MITPNNTFENTEQQFLQAFKKLNIAFLLNKAGIRKAGLILGVMLVEDASYGGKKSSKIFTVLSLSLSIIIFLLVFLRLIHWSARSWEKQILLKQDKKENYAIQEKEIQKILGECSMSSCCAEVQFSFS